MSETSTSAILQLQQLGKVFHTDEMETHALADISLTITAGDFIALTGPSGCGKTTLLSILGLLETPSSGQYQLDGHNVAQLDARTRAQIRNNKIGFIFQAFNLIPNLTVEENVTLPLTFRDNYNRQAARERVHAVLEQVGMAHRLRHYPGQLSGGQQQRVAVARALAGEPRILLADEPAGNLDQRNGEAVMHLLEEINRAGATLVLVTHDPAHARRAQRIVHLLDGKIVDAATYERLRDAHAVPSSIQGIPA